MAGLVPAIHVFSFANRSEDVAGTRPGMTKRLAVPGGVTRPMAEMANER
jgi:hypothetical protein